MFKVVGFLLAFLFAFPAFSHTYCVRDGMGLLEGFRKSHQELPVGWGPTDTGIMYMLASKDGRTYTIIHIDTHGVACVLASGESLEYWGFPEKDEEL